MLLMMMTRLGCLVLSVERVATPALIRYKVRRERGFRMRIKGRPSTLG